ncbi:hypothetical protein [Plasmodium yoelii yoelii]|nr:hypothetical protein [Plasmodium yoelii yoelii]
MLRNCLFRSNF